MIGEIEMADPTVNVPADPTASLPASNDVAASSGGLLSAAGSSPLANLGSAVIGAGLASASNLTMAGSSGVPYGAMTSLLGPALAQFLGTKDQRAVIKVPQSYLVGPSAGPSYILQMNGGILFPYTPAVTVQNQAQYSTQQPTHSNYALNFYQKSSVGPIRISGKFTVQNEYEGAVLLGIIHLLRSLTKMRWGTDSQAGSPPPVCKFNAFGDYMFANVPVAITGWSHDLPDGVDYITVGRPGTPTTYGTSMVPTISTINIDMNVMYSRQEMLNYSVDKWSRGALFGRGYL